MDRKTRLLLGIFCAIVALVVLAAYHRYYYARDFDISQEVSCNPTEEPCFARSCEEDCEGEIVDYYKIRTIHASALSFCDPHFSECLETQCTETASCYETSCTDEVVPEGEECNDPETYRMAHPLEELSEEISEEEPEK